MDDRDAAGVLGLETGEALTRDRLRRAYLRRLRAHPPERDPAGFQRLRAAFELLDARAQLYGPELLGAMLASRPTNAAHGGASDDVRDDAIDDVIDEPRAAAADNDDNNDDHDAGVQPGADDATPSGSPDAAPSAAPDTATAGSPDPGAPRPKRREAPDRDRAPHTPHSAPRLLGPALDDPAASYTLGELTRAALALLARGEIDEAEVLAHRARREVLDDIRARGMADLSVWALTRQLIAVAPVLPLEIVQSVAAAIASDDLASAEPAVRAYQRAHERRAMDLYVHLRKRAPNLHLEIGAWLLRPRSGAPSPADASERRWAWGATAAVIAVLAVLRLVFPNPGSEGPRVDLSRVPVRLQDAAAPHDAEVEAAATLLRRLRAQRATGQPSDRGGVCGELERALAGLRARATYDGADRGTASARLRFQIELARNDWCTP